MRLSINGHLKVCESFILAAAVLSVAMPAFASTLNLSTGYNSGGTLICASGATSCSGSDANWNVVDYGDSFSNTPTPSQAAKIVNPSDADWYGGWVANASATPASDWIAYDPSNCCDNGLGIYTVIFILSAADLSTVSLSGSWTLDDSGVLLLNGNQLGSLSGDWGSMNAFTTVTAGSSDFVLGVNTLQAEITGSDVYLEGVNVSATLTGYTATATTPEPSHITMVLAAGVILLVFARRKALV
jgi:hypothetical protein